MTEFRVSEAAALLGVSDDTVRRWGEHGRFTLRRGANGMQVVDGTELVPLMAELASGGALAEAFPLARASARNRFVGLVTRVQRESPVLPPTAHGVVTHAEQRGGLADAELGHDDLLVCGWMTRS